MTHEEATPLLPVYALGALDDASELEAHLRDCDRCAAELASYLETTATLGAAVEQVAPPDRLRRSVLASLSDAPRVPRRPLPTWPSMGRFSLGALAAAAILIVGLGVAVVAQQAQLRSAREELALDQSGLALLTSTETTVVRLAPSPGFGGDAHGHWYHRAGVATQVLVIEFMPPPPAGSAYYGWLQRADGSWQRAGTFALDDRGYGRIILVGSDGADVRGVVVTLQNRATAAPSGAVALRWPAA